MISLLILFSCTSEVAIDKDAETKAIHGVLQSFFDSAAALDAEAIRTFLTDDFLAFDMAKVMNTEDLMNAFASFEQMGLTEVNYKIEPVKSEIYATSALLCYKNSGTAKMGDQDIMINFIESCFFDKTEEGWKIKFLHSTEVPPPTPDTEMGTE